MELGLSTYFFSNDRLSARILDQILDAELRTLELYADRRHLDYYDSRHVRDVAQWFEDSGVSLHSVHAPTSKGEGGRGTDNFPISLAHLEKHHRLESMDEIKRVMDLAEQLPFHFLIVHLGGEGEQHDLRKFDAAFSSIEHLRAFAKERGAQILIENTPDDLGAPQRLHSFLEYTHLDVKICLDVGHAHLTGGVQPALKTLESLIASVHIHDNRGVNDDHFLPFAGTIEWEPTLRALGRLKGRVSLLLEPRDYGPESGGMTEIQEAIRKLSALAEQESSGE